MMVRSRILFIFLTFGISLLVFYSFFTYDISRRAAHQTETLIISGVLAGISEDFRQEADASFSDTERWTKYKDYLSQFDSRKYALYIVTPDGNKLSSSDANPVDEEILQTILLTSEATGHVEISDRHYVWSKQQIDKTRTQAVIIFETTESRGAIFTSIGTPTIVSGLIVIWVSIWAALILSFYTSKQLLDPIIKLPTRNLFQSHADKAIQRALKHNSPIGICVVDINHFKDINNTLGYSLGNKILRIIASRIKTTLRSSDLVASLGGDKFCILIGGISKNDMKGCARRTLNAIKKPVSISGIDVEIDASIGFSLYPENGNNADILIQRAEVAMLHAKKTGQDFFIYTPESDPHSLTKLALLGELRQALESNSLELFFQPKIDLRSNRICGLEALIRWNHPDMGMIPPDDFIPLAENSGLIRPLSHWVIEYGLNRCVNCLHKWPNLSISINLSARNLHDDTLPDFIAQSLKDRSIPTNRLNLEITETALTLDPARSSQVIARLHAMGIKLSLDDYGTGYTSLSFLKQLPLSEIKIDRTFVKDMVFNHNDQAIVRTTIDLAQHLGLDVVAEGVETLECLDLLRQMGCNTVQGYYLCRPLKENDVLEWIQTSAWGITERIDILQSERIKPKLS